MRLLFEGGFYSRAVCIRDFTVIQFGIFTYTINIIFRNPTHTTMLMLSERNPDSRENHQTQEYRQIIIEIFSFLLVDCQILKHQIITFQDDLIHHLSEMKLWNLQIGTFKQFKIVFWIQIFSALHVLMHQHPIWISQTQIYLPIQPTFKGTMIWQEPGSMKKSQTWKILQATLN